MLVIIALSACAVIVFILGAVWMIPEVRASYYLRRGKTRRARKIYETLLERNPEKLQLYRKLGEIYYLENRQDKKALRLFEIILKLKIPFQWKDDISTLVAKYYIMEGRKDTEAIKLIEKTVDKELKRMKSFA